MDNFQIYELCRDDRDGGGIAIGIKNELQPAWVRDGKSIGVEALSVMISVRKFDIRLCVA